ncbi:MAG: Fur family transcriptional regulator [Planctomycetota bacterium]|jgi:Fe2+ or Zn2+ uptake regulation protein
MMNQKAIDLLDAANLRQTAPRLAILNALLDADHPLTQEQIADDCGSDAPNKTTIYRTLMNLVEKNLVHKAYLEDRSWHFELAHQCGKHQCHPHFTCTQCQQTQCLTSAEALPLVKLPTGYSMQRQQVHIDGICPDCQTK